MASSVAVPVVEPTGPHPFDAVAPEYDASFTDTKLGRWYRRMVRDRVSRYVRSGDHVLELGCGTGEDAVWLAKLGIRVTATDVSSRMLEVTRAKVQASGFDAMINCYQLDLNCATSSSIPALEDKSGVRVVLANFGPLNCVEDRVALARWLAGVVRPGGYVIATVMGPLCPWETIWHSARLEFRTAIRRLRSGKQAHVGAGGSMPVWYPSARRLESEFEPCFTVVERSGLGLLLPPSGMARLVERFPGLFRFAAVVDRRAAHLRPWIWLNDHYLLVMQRRTR